MRCCRTLYLAILLACVPTAGAAQVSSMPAPLRSAAADVPVVTVRYSPLLDAECAHLRNRPLDSALVASVRRQERAYAAEWAARGPALLRAAREAVGAPFPFREMHAALSTCWAGSMSFPLIVKVKSAGQTQTDSAAAAALFVGSLFHEVLHTYVNDVRGEVTQSVTPLLTKHQGESSRVRNHLHLLALQRLVYNRLGLGADFRLVMAAEGASDPAVLGRAHEIVIAEGAAAFVRELEAAGRRRAPQR